MLSGTPGRNLNLIGSCITVYLNMDVLTDTYIHPFIITDYFSASYVYYNNYNFLLI